MVIKNGKAVGGGGREIRQIRPIGLIGDRRDRIPGDRTPMAYRTAQAPTERAEPYRTRGYRTAQAPTGRRQAPTGRCATERRQAPTERRQAPTERRQAPTERAKPYRTRSYRTAQAPTETKAMR